MFRLHLSHWSGEGSRKRTLYLSWVSWNGTKTWQSWWEPHRSLLKETLSSVPVLDGLAQSWGRPDPPETCDKVAFTRPFSWSAWIDFQNRSFFIKGILEREHIFDNDYKPWQIWSLALNVIDIALKRDHHANTRSYWEVTRDVSAFREIKWRNMMRVQDKVAIVTGGGSGLGQTFSTALAREGARIVVLD